MNLFVRKERADFVWNINGSFGKLAEKTVIESNTYSAHNGKVSVVSKI